MLIDIIYKTVKPSHLEKLQIIQNLNKLNVPSYLHIFWLNFDVANHSFLHPFRLWETGFQKILPGILSGGLGHEYKCIVDSMHFLAMWTPQIEKVLPYMLEYRSQKIQQAFLREKTLRSLKKYERMYPWG